MAETINVDELIIGHRYEIFNPSRPYGSQGSIDNPLIGDFVGVSNDHKGALFKNLAHTADMNLHADFTIEYRLGNGPREWIVLLNDRNSMLRRKNELERPRGRYGVSLKNEILQQGPWNPRRAERSGFAHMNSDNDPDLDFEPTVHGFGRSLLGGRYKRKSRRAKSRRAKSHRSMV